MLNRRHFLQAAAATALATRGAFATVPGEKRFVFIFLRGGLDGLHALAPFADAAYRRLRPRLALGSDAVLSLDGYFGLPRALAPLIPLFQDGELLLIPAVATRYRSRSHFDGQNLLENGSARPFGARDGWLNRAILGLNHGDRRLGLSLGPTVPLILRGGAGIQTYVVSPLPEVDDDYLFRLAQVYRSDPLFAQAFAAARASAEPDVEGLGGGPLARQDFSLSARVAADLLSRATGPRIGVLEMQGWRRRRGGADRRRVAGPVADRPVRGARCRPRQCHGEPVQGCAARPSGGIGARVVRPGFPGRRCGASIRRIDTLIIPELSGNLKRDTRTSDCGIQPPGARAPGGIIGAAAFSVSMAKPAAAL